MRLPIPVKPWGIPSLKNACRAHTHMRTHTHTTQMSCSWPPPSFLSGAGDALALPFFSSVPIGLGVCELKHTDGEKHHHQQQQQVRLRSRVRRRRHMPAKICVSEPVVTWWSCAYGLTAAAAPPPPHKMREVQTWLKATAGSGTLNTVCATHSRSSLNTYHPQYEFRAQESIRGRTPLLPLGTWSKNEKSGTATSEHHRREK